MNGERGSLAVLPRSFAAVLVSLMTLAVCAALAQAVAPRTADSSSPARPAAAVGSIGAPKLSVERPCITGRCRATISVLVGAPARLQVSLQHRGAARDFAPSITVRCSGGGEEPCVAEGTLRGSGTVVVAIRVTPDAGAPSFTTRRVVVRRNLSRSYGSHPLCAQAAAGDNCQDGGGRRVPGGGEKVSHKGWPAITGVFWQAKGTTARRFTGGPDQDELLGHHGSDRIFGAPGNDVLWGDWDPKNNNAWQRDVLDGGDGNDWIYTSHGHNTVRGGRGNDYVWAYYGRGTIDCGPGFDTLRIRLDNRYRVRNCERIKNFCAHGSKPGLKGGCYKPGEKPRGPS